MPKRINLTLVNGDIIRVLPDAVVVIRPDTRQGRTVIDLLGGTTYVVMEPPEQVERLVE